MGFRAMSDFVTFCFFFQAEDGIRDKLVTGVQTCALPICIPAILLADPINIRYATGVRNMQPWSMHSNLRMALVPAEGGTVLFEYLGSEHLAAGLETVAEVRAAKSRVWPAPGDRPDGVCEQALRLWSDEIVSVLRAIDRELRVAIDR